MGNSLWLWFQSLRPLEAFIQEACEDLSLLEICDIVDPETTWRMMGSNVFDNAASAFAISYSNTSTGFTSPTWNGYPTNALSLAGPELITYSVNGESVGITGYPTTGSGKLIIPEKIEGKPVTSIGQAAFSSCQLLTSITIPTTVTNIGVDAFKGCTGLTSIDLPDAITSIGNGAFDGCSNLNTATFYGNAHPRSQCISEYDDQFHYPLSKCSHRLFGASLEWIFCN